MFLDWEQDGNTVYKRIISGYELKIHDWTTSGYNATITITNTIGSIVVLEKVNATDINDIKTHSILIFKKYLEDYRDKTVSKYEKLIKQINNIIQKCE